MTTGTVNYTDQLRERFKAGAANLPELRELAHAIHQEVRAFGKPSQMTSEHLDRLHDLNNELSDVSDAISAKQGMGGGLRFPGSGKSADMGDSLGGAVIESAAFKSFDPRVRGSVSGAIDIPLALLEQKNTITASSFAPQAVRETLILPKALEALSVADLFAQGQTDQNSVVYMEETTATNNAAETAEGTAKPESDLVFTERTSPIRKIATFLRVSDEMLADVHGFADYLSQRVPMLVQMREDQQLISGNGVGVNLTGILSASGLLTQAKGADPTPDSIYKAITLIRQTAFLEPDAMLVHPADWQDIRLLRTADGLYIFGNPADPAPQNMFGLKVVVTTRMTQNTLIVGAFKTAARLVRRESLRIAISTEDATNFTTNLVTILAELREALVFFRGSGFCSVTGV